MSGAARGKVSVFNMMCAFPQSMAGVVISLLVASTLVSATQCLKALYLGGMFFDSKGLRPWIQKNNATNVSILRHKAKK